MKRVDLLLPDKIANNVEIFKQAEGILTWSKSIVKLVDLGLRYYCDIDRTKEEAKIAEMFKYLDHINANYHKLNSLVHNYLIVNNTKTPKEEK